MIIDELNLENVKNMCGNIIEMFEKQNEGIRELELENAALKEGIWKEEEMSRLKSEYEQMKADYYRGFPITEKQQKMIREFIDKNKSPIPMKIDGVSVSYKFTPTPLGIVGEVINTRTGDKLVFKGVDE